VSIDSEIDIEANPMPTTNGYRFTRSDQGHPHVPRKPRAANDPDYAEHPAITRGLDLFRNSASGGAAAHTLLRTPTLDVSYAWFKSGFPLPLHSHDVDCYYLVIAGEMKVGTEVLGKGDGVFIPAGAPYTVTPGDEGVEFIEMRTSPDYDTHYRAKTDSYWDRVAETLRERKGIWAQEKAPYGLIPVPDPSAA
jgi:mannose-6-phosphate isomerase-like protein (cupin superfamily)